METRSPELKTELSHRLRRIEGQVRGVQRMVDEDRDCPEILQQMTAIRSADAPGEPAAGACLRRSLLGRTDGG